MIRPTSSSRHWKAAAKAIAEYLAGQTEPVPIFSLTGVADEGARAIGRKTDLFPSLYDYVELLPANWTTAWVGKGGTSDSLYYATPKGWQSGQVKLSLTATLLGVGDVKVVASPDA